MTERRERADAARNRRAILRATETLLARHPPDQVSLEQIAAAAGVGKGTVFHRFGSRAGLMRSLMYERAHSLQEAVITGPPPLGPGAPAQQRLLAFLEAVVDVVARNISLVAALGDRDTTQRPPDDPRHVQPVYPFWHGHVAALLAAERPDLDAETLAHILLGSLHSDPILDLLRQGHASRVAACLRALLS
jgi:AcrR family transcriptional regulator